MKKVSMYDTRDEGSIGRAPASTRPWISLARAMVADACREGSLEWFGTYQGQLCMDALEYTPSTTKDILDACKRRCPKKTRDKGLHLFRGRYKSVARIARETGIPDRTIRGRLRRGASIEEATREDYSRARNNHLYPWKGEMLTIPEIGRREGVPAKRISRRISNGWELRRAVYAPPSRGKGGGE